MSRRSLAIIIAAFLESGLLIAALVVRVPYVRLSPGSTVDVLSTVGGEERVTVQGAKAYYDGGELRMTTVSATPPEEEIGILEALRGWLSDEQAVKPRELVYSEDETDEESAREGAQQMQSSQDYAVAVALRELGYDVPQVPVVSAVVAGLPADGALSIGDEIVAVNGKRTPTPKAVGKGVQQVEVGSEVAITVRRAGEKETYRIKPVAVEVDGETVPRIGIEIGVDYKFPFEVSINIGEDIGGPSAGLMFSLAVFDTLTPGSLTGGHIIAGTGEILPDGTVGQIGGIEQKIVGAGDAGAELFLVPSDNCDDALGAPNGDTRLVRVTSFEEAKSAIEAWVDDPDAELPSCEDEA